MTVKKIGNLVIYLFFSTLFSVKDDNINIKLNVFDINGSSLENPGLGMPFIIELTTESNNQESSLPTIKNLENFDQSNVSVSTTFSNINGKTKIIKKYQYEVRIDKEGSYSFGPVFMEGHTYNQKLNVIVKKDQKISNQSKKDVIFKIFISKNTVYVNEGLKLRLKFYFKDKINISNFIFPKMNDFIIDKMKKEFSGTDKIKDEKFSFVEYEYLIYPKSTGEIIIPSFKVIYEEYDLNANNFFNLFGPQIIQKEILSNSLSLKVLPLPYNNENVNVVGNFENFTATVNQKAALQSEGIVLKLEIESKNNLDNIKLNKINLPENCKYYESKNYINELNNKTFRKTFEFIIQCNDIGKIKIPEQKFSFFNPRNKEYQNLKTKPILLAIKPLNNKNTLIKSNLEQEKQKLMESEVGHNNFNKKIYGITLEIKKLIILLLLIVLFIKMLFYCKRYISNFISNKFLDKQLTKSLYKQILTAKQHNDYLKMYRSFIEFFIFKYNINQSDINHDIIEEKLKKIFPSEIFEQWNIFFSNIIKLSFCQTNNNQKNNFLFIDALKWVNIFKKKL